MDILKAGNLHDPNEDTFDGRCIQCNAIVRFKRREGNVASGGPPSDPAGYIWVWCPTKKCGKKICVGLDAANKRLEGF